MTDVSGVSGPSQTPIGTDSTEATAAAGAPRPAIDTGTVETADRPAQSAASLPPGPRIVDYDLASSAAAAMSATVVVDYGHIAALMMQIDSQLARAARDSQVQQIQSVAEQMHASADDLRAAAKYALAGGVVSGGVQVASAGISIGGGIKGMSLTKTAVNVEAQAPESETLPASPETSPSSTGSATEEPQATVRATGETGSVGGESVQPEGGSSASEEAQTEQVRQDTTREVVEEVSAGKQKATAVRLDHTLSQQLSARSQNVALLTDGLSKLTGATGEIIKSALDYESKQKEADSKEDDARAEEERAYLERTKGFADSMQKGAQDMLQAFQQMEASRNETHKQIWSRA